MKTVRVFIAASVRFYREGLAAILAHEEGIEVVGTTSDRGDALASVRALEPDVVLLDSALPRSVETIRKLADPAAGKHVVALASPDVEAELIARAEAGVSGYVARDDSVADLAAAIRGVVRGQLLCSPTTAATLLRRVAALSVEGSVTSAEGRLTQRELQIVRLIDDGLSNKQIASQLGIQLPTVKNHVHHILEKLEVARRGEAAAHMRLSGLLHSARPLASPKG